jgi:hypothetical protein
MLGVRRPGVTIAFNLLESQGLIYASGGRLGSSAVPGLERPRTAPTAFRKPSSTGFSAKDKPKNEPANFQPA